MWSIPTIQMGTYISTGLPQPTALRNKAVRYDTFQKNLGFGCSTFTSRSAPVIAIDFSYCHCFQTPHQVRHQLQRLRQINRLLELALFLQATPVGPQASQPRQLNLQLHEPCLSTIGEDPNQAVPGISSTNDCEREGGENEGTDAAENHPAQDKVPRLASGNMSLKTNIAGYRIYTTMAPHAQFLPLTKHNTCLTHQ